MLIKKIYSLAIGVTAVSITGALVSHLTKSESRKIEKKSTPKQTTYDWDAGSDGGFIF